jgi:hypothetical protein
MIKMPTKSTLKRQAKQGKFAYRCSAMFERTKLHQNSIKSLVKPIICLNFYRLLFFSLYESRQFFKMFAIFERIKQRINERRK